MRPYFLVAACLVLLVAPSWAQEEGGQSIKDKLRSTLPP